MESRWNQGDPFQTPAGRAYAAVREMVSSGELKPGETVTLRPLAKRLGMSITPVRSALAMLSHQKVLERNSSGGFQVMRMTEERIRGYFAVREALLAQSGRMAAERITDGEVSALRELGDRLDRLKASGPLSEVRALERRFHLMIARIAACKEVEEEILRLGVLDTLYPPAIRPLGRSHRVMVEALATRDPACVDKETRLHVASGLEDVLAGLHASEEGEDSTRKEGRREAECEEEATQAGPRREESNRR